MAEYNQEDNHEQMADTRYVSRELAIPAGKGSSADPSPAGNKQANSRPCQRGVTRPEGKSYDNGSEGEDEAFI